MPDTPPLADQIDQNIESVLSIHRREWETRTSSEKRIEQVRRVIGQPGYLIVIIVASAVWIAGNQWMVGLGKTAFDPYPYPLLDGVLSLAGIISTTVVLISQSLQTRLEQQHTHLVLQLTLLNEQKVSKVIHLIEELREDLPMVKDRHDPQAESLKQTADAASVVSAIDHVGLSSDPRREEPK